MEIPNQQFLLQILDDAIAKCSQKPDDEDCLAVKSVLLSARGGCSVDMEFLLEYTKIFFRITDEAYSLLLQSRQEVDKQIETINKQQPIGFVTNRP